MTVELKFTLKVIKANLTFNKIRLNIPFTTLPFHGHFICFYELHFRFKSKTIILIYLTARLFLSFELNFLDKNSWVSDNQI